MAELDRENGDLIYGLEDRPSPLLGIFAAFQHLLAIFVGIITPPLIICQAIGLDVRETSYIVSMALLVSGISTFVQVRRIGGLGSGLLSIQGTSFSFLGPIIVIAKSGGLALVFGVCLVGSVIEMILSRFLKFATRIITPLVCGIVVSMIGLSLIKVGIIQCAGGYGAYENGTFGSLRNLSLAALVFITIIFVNHFKNRYLRMSSIVIGLAIGYLAAICMGMIDFSTLNKVEIFNLPQPFKYGFHFNLAAFAPIALIYLITAIESVGDLTATSMVSKEPVTGPLYFRRISGGVLGDGFNSALAAVFNSFPNTTFSQNNGVIQLTGVASRYVGYYLAAMLVILGLFPIVGAVFSLMPLPVLGGATLIMFGTVAAAGIKIIASVEIDRRAVMIMAIAFSLGLGVELVPDVIKVLPENVGNIVKSGITVGGIAAIICNLVFPRA